MQQRLNIPSYLEDNCYAYKMPSLDLKTISTKHGKHTRIVNIKEIAQCLRVSPIYILKFMGYELKSSIKAENNTIDGAFTEPELRKYVDKFIDKYVLCNLCRYPEVRLQVKDGKLRKNCMSCGKKDTVNDEDKLTLFIIKDQLKIKESRKKRESEDLTEESLIVKIREVYSKYSNIDKKEDLEQIIHTVKKIVPECHTDKIHYLIFNAIFDINIAKQITKNKAILVESYKISPVLNPEMDILLNLQRFLLLRYSDVEFEKYIPTILKLFYDEDLLSGDFLLDWDQGGLNSKMMMDFRYEKSVGERFRTASKSMINWLKKEDGKQENQKEDQEIDIDSI